MVESPRNIVLIARREFLEKIRGRAFRLSTILVPGLMILMLSGSYFVNRRLGVGDRVVIAADSRDLAEAVRGEMAVEKDSRLTVDTVAAASEAERAALSDQVRHNAIEGYLWLRTSGDGSLNATYVSGSGASSSTAQSVKAALNQVVLRKRLAAEGMDPSDIEQMLKGIQLDSLQLNYASKGGRSSISMMLAKIMLEIFLLTMPILLYGMDMARSIIDEKSSRIFEVMLSAVSPSEMLTGKLIGIGAVGVSQIAIWVAAAGLLSGSTVASTLISGRFRMEFSWGEGILFPVYFVLGFLLYSSLFSGLAATCESVQEFQMYAPLAVLPTWFSFGIIPILVNNPHSPWAVGASLFPLTAPFTMVPRIGLQMPPVWQIAASIGLLILSIWGVLWFSSRLYRIGILMYGKRATLPEIIRWLRYS